MLQMALTYAADIFPQQAFFRKLKFQYLEQKAKDQYIKIIVSDDAPSITAADNKVLQEANEAKKQKLKEQKLGLSEVQNNIRTLAPLVEQGMSAFLKHYFQGILTISRSH